MAPGVIADEVTGGSDAAHECRLRLCIAADKEERGADTVTGQGIQKAGSPGWVGAIVKGEGDLAGTIGRDEGLAKDPRSRRECGIGTPARGKGKPAGSPQARRDFCGQMRIHCPIQCAVMKEPTAR